MSRVVNRMRSASELVVDFQTGCQCDVTQLKELKKQVQSERSRADRLQEKLQQFLAESPHSQQSTYIAVMWPKNVKCTSRTFTLLISNHCLFCLCSKHFIC